MIFVIALGTGLIPLVIRYDQTLKEAASYGQPIEAFKPDSHGAEDYRSLCEWLIEHASIDRPEPDELIDEDPMESDIKLVQETEVVHEAEIVSGGVVGKLVATSISAQITETPSLTRAQGDGGPGPDAQ